MAQKRLPTQTQKGNLAIPRKREGTGCACCLVGGRKLGVGAAALDADFARTLRRYAGSALWALVVLGSPGAGGPSRWGCVGGHQ
eukprot:7376168-Lingulodinium_polyedra.AAC.1